jgi:broad specificity phosphatase PhoE
MEDLHAPLLSPDELRRVPCAADNRAALRLRFLHHHYPGAPRRESPISPERSSADEFERTRQTAAPLATARGITPRIIAIGTGTAQQNADDVSEAILASHRGQTVLIVGHSNTIPLIIQRLGVATVVAIPENDFDNLFVVTVPARGPARLVRVQYGAPSP